MRARAGPHGRPASAPTENTPLVTPAAPKVTLLEVWRTIRPFAVPNTWPLRLLAVVSLALVVLSKIITLLPPIAYKYAVDQLTQNRVKHLNLVPVLPVIAFVAARLSVSLLNAVRDLCYNIVSSHCTMRFGSSLFQHLQQLSLAFHLRRKTGEVTRVVDRGINSIDTVTNTVLFTIGPTLLEVCLVMAVFLHLGTAHIAFTVAITVAIYFGYTFYFTSWRISIRRGVIDADNAVSTKAIDTLLNYETVKMFGMEEVESEEYDKLQADYRDQYIKLRFSLNTLNFGQNAIQFIGTGICMLFTAVEVANERLSVGDFVLVNTYVSQLFSPLFFLGGSYRMLTQAAADLEKCVVLIKEPVTVKDTEYSVPLDISNQDVMEGKRGAVTFKNVSFKYSGGERGSVGGLRNISFTVPPGKMLALVGASGVGKSTVMRLLMRFYDVDSGSIQIDGEDIKSFTQASLRRRIGVVAQETILFNSSLRDNIGYGKLGASDPEIFRAARSAALGPFLESLPTGLDTVVGERGVRLSGGERQRVGCARCLIKDPAIVLLDEATSALDTLTERSVQANLREVCQNRTTIAVAHRLSTVMMADEIVVLGKGDAESDDENEAVGRIIERGTHAELLEMNGTYAEMWVAQTAAANEEKETTDK